MSRLSIILWSLAGQRGSWTALIATSISSPALCWNFLHVRWLLCDSISHKRSWASLIVRSSSRSTGPSNPRVSTVRSSIKFRKRGLIWQLFDADRILYIRSWISVWSSRYLRTLTAFKGSSSNGSLSVHLHYEEFAYRRLDSLVVWT